MPAERASNSAGAAMAAGALRRKPARPSGRSQAARASHPPEERVRFPSWAQRSRKEAQKAWARRLRRCRSRGRAFGGCARRACRWVRGHCRTGISASRKWSSGPTCRWVHLRSSRRGRAQIGSRKCAGAWEPSVWALASSGASSISSSPPWWKKRRLTTRKSWNSIAAECEYTQPDELRPPVDFAGATRAILPARSDAPGRGPSRRFSRANARRDGRLRGGANATNGRGDARETARQTPRHSRAREARRARAIAGAISSGPSALGHYGASVVGSKPRGADVARMRQRHRQTRETTDEHR